MAALSRLALGPNSRARLGPAFFSTLLAEADGDELGGREDRLDRADPPVRSDVAAQDGTQRLTTHRARERDQGRGNRVHRADRDLEAAVAAMQRRREVEPRDPSTADERRGERRVRA